MAALLLHVGATVQCAHGGAAQPVAPNPRVRVSGAPVVTQPAPYAVAGCASTTPGPCVTAHWVTGAVRVKIMGQPAVLSDSQAICTPTGQPLHVVATQPRVKGR
jgi:hypothetical protein